MIKAFISCVALCMLSACSAWTQRSENAASLTLECPKCPDICATQNTDANNGIPAGGSPLPVPETILDFTNRFSMLSAEEQKRELAQINENLKQNKFDFNYRMKAALVYALPGTRLRDTGKAQALLDGLMRENALDAQRKALVNLLRDYIAENGKLAQENARLLQENTTLAQKGRDEQKRADGLQQTLNELKAIEKSISSREQELNK